MTVSLRTRLTLFFVAIVVLPVTAVTILGWRAVARSSDRQVRSELEHSRRSAMLVFAGQVEQAADVVRALAGDPALQRAMAARDRARLQAVLERWDATELLVAVTGPDGRVLARAGRTEPSFLAGVVPPAPRALLAPRPGPGGCGRYRGGPGRRFRPPRSTRAGPCCNAAASPSTGVAAPGARPGRARSAR